MNELSHYPIHHIAIAVHDIDEAARRYREDFSFHELPREEIEAFGASVAFLLPQKTALAGQTAIELIAPLSKESTITTFLEKRGEGLHHICFSVPDIVAEQKRLLELSYRFTSDKPRTGAHHGLVLFIHPKSASGVLVELREEQTAPQ